MPAGCDGLPLAEAFSEIEHELSVSSGSLQGKGRKKRVSREREG